MTPATKAPTKSKGRVSRTVRLRPEQMSAVQAYGRRHGAETFDASLRVLIAEVAESGTVLSTERLLEKIREKLERLFPDHDRDV